MKKNASVPTDWSFTGSSSSSWHAKIILFDRRKFFVGSMNFDPRSLNLNTEMAVVIENRDFVEYSLNEAKIQLPEAAYQVVIEDGDIVWKDYYNDETLYSEPDAGLLLRMGAWIAGILPIEEQR